MRLKNKSDLSEFPDGGRATLVRRYSPTLAIADAVESDDA